MLNTLRNKKEKNTEIAYPWELCRFDKDLLRLDGGFISDEKILSLLQDKSLSAKIIWESRFEYFLLLERDLRISILEKELSSRKNGRIADWYFLPNLCMSIEFAKILSSSGRLSRHKHLSFDRRLIEKYYSESVEQLRLDISSSGIFWDVSCFHPYVQAALSKNDFDLLEFIRSSEYKKYEGNFVRASNSESKHLKDVFYNEISANREIFVIRYDVSIDSLVLPKGVEFQEIRDGLDIVVERIKTHFSKNLRSAVDVIFPRSLAIKNKEKVEGLVGHLLLIFSGISKSEQSLVSDCAFQSLYGTGIGLIPICLAGPSQKNSASGVLRFSDPKSLPALAKAAEFLTIERRFIRPRAFPREHGRPARPHTLRVRTF